MIVWCTVLLSFALSKATITSILDHAPNSTFNTPIFASFAYEQGSNAITVAEDNQITVIDIFDNLIISMDIIIHSIFDGFSQNVFHIGNSKKFENYPSIFINKNARNGFKIRVTNDDNSHHTFSTHHPIELGTNYHIEIAYKQNLLMINMNNKAIVWEQHFGKHTLYRNKSVYGGDPWHRPANATVTNLKVYGWNDIDIKKSQLTLHELYKKHLSNSSVIGIFVAVILLILIACLCYLNCFSFKKYIKAKEEFEFEGCGMNKNDIINLKIKNMKNRAAHKMSHNLESDHENEMHSFSLYV